MPESSFVPEIYGIDLNSFVALKERWKVSISSIIMRLSYLEFISEEKKTRLFQMMSMKKIRRHEPLDNLIKVENTRIVSKIVELLSVENILSGEDFYNLVGLKHTALFSNLTGISEDKFATKPLSDNVVVLRRP